MIDESRMATKRWTLSFLSGFAWGQVFLGALLYTSPLYLDALNAAAGQGVGRLPSSFGPGWRYTLMLALGSVVLEGIGAVAYLRFRELLPSRAWTRGIAFGALFWVISDASRGFYNFLMLQEPLKLIGVDLLNSLLIDIVVFTVFAIEYERRLAKDQTTPSSPTAPSGEQPQRDASA